VIALATCRALPDLDPDDRLLRDALGAADAVVWDDPAVDWEAYELVVIRSTWDYISRREAFLAWARSLGGRVLNPAAVLAWNTDKRYLADLAGASLPVVETAFLEPGEALASAVPPVVVKPAVGAGSIDAARHDDVSAAAAHAARLHADGRVAMVQPYVAHVDQAGETALVYVAGAFSHAVRKGPLLGAAAAQADTSGLFLAEEIAPREPSTAERAAADSVMAWVAERFGTLLYARVDLLGGEEPAVLELELTEPSLFLGHATGAAERLAAAIATRTP
jgi:glutathione synthase/RimK-type ligase-like ATP-grasp enzyme